MSCYANVLRASNFIQASINPYKPVICVVLGSGLGAFADTLERSIIIPYDKIPGFAVSTAQGHKGRLVIGELNGIVVVAMQGRVHLHEGYPVHQVVLPVRAMAMLGCRVFIITNAAGAINKHYRPGDFIFLEDHIYDSSPLGPSPLVGLDDSRLGPYFPDMTRCYNPELRDYAKIVFEQVLRKMPKNGGVYRFHWGPEYETPALIKKYEGEGATLAGMSTVPSIIALNQMAQQKDRDWGIIRALTVTCVTNMAAGMQSELNHGEVKDQARRSKGDFIKLLSGLIIGMPREYIS